MGNTDLDRRDDFVRGGKALKLPNRKHSFFAFLFIYVHNQFAGAQYEQQVAPVCQQYYQWCQCRDLS